jgi:radical SAM superfamily enzyme YgiQ (UPF0313 family)
MRVLLANPAYRVPLADGWEQYFFCAGSRCPWSLVKKPSERPRYAMFPFFLGYTAALLRDDGFDVRVLDGVPLSCSTAEFAQRVKRLAPDVLVFEPATVSIAWVLDLARDLKQTTGARLVLAGAHATVERLSILRDHPHVDFVIAGEYEFPCRDLLRRLRAGQPPGGLAGISGRTAGGELFDGGVAPPIESLDSLPFPAREMFPTNDQPDLDLYHDGFCQARPAAQIHSSRGCPFCCSYCVLPQVLYGRGRYRTFSAPRIVDEMERLVRDFGAREVYFDDDTFMGNREHVLDLCREIRARGFTTPWSAMGDAMIGDEDVLRAMASSGCVGIKFGLESTSAEVLRSIGKPLRPERLAQLCRFAAALGLKTHVSVSFGHLADTVESICDTFAFACKLDVDSVQFSIATPYPGTRFFHEARQQGFLPGLDFSQLDPWHHAPLTAHRVPKDFLEPFQAGAHRRWLEAKLRQPRWLWRQTRLLRRVVRTQGWHGLRSRARRGVDILFAKTFR